MINLKMKNYIELIYFLEYLHYERACTQKSYSMTVK